MRFTLLGRYMNIVHTFEGPDSGSTIAKASVWLRDNVFSDRVNPVILLVQEPSKSLFTDAPDADYYLQQDVTGEMIPLMLVL